jgi:hypothetical protein
MEGGGGFVRVSRTVGGAADFRRTIDLLAVCLSMLLTAPFGHRSSAPSRIMLSESLYNRVTSYRGSTAPGLMIRRLTRRFTLARSCRRNWAKQRAAPTHGGSRRVNCSARLATVATLEADGTDVLPT